jgi:hypothetical protein
LTGFKSTRLNRYLQYCQFESEFWEWITEVVYGEDMTPMDARRYVRQVSSALGRISSVNASEWRG